uniref:PPM-type phosphatase domain-containing protein n=1 Tax=Noctiluca scintillans TaxID=2966 RepID=A0A7S1B113_NOCSC
MAQAPLELVASPLGHRRFAAMSVRSGRLKGVDIEEHSAQGKTQRWFSLEQLHLIIEQCRKEGVRLEASAVQGSKVIVPRLDVNHQPVHLVRKGWSAFEHWQTTPVSLGVDGAPKSGARRDGVYGEDAVATATIPLPSAVDLHGFQVDWLYAADGHGGKGAPTAALARDLFLEKMTELAPTICRLTRAGDVKEAIEVMQTKGHDVVVREVEAAAKKNDWTGSTVTQMLTVTLPEGQRVAYTSNMGDSPAAVILLSGARAAAGPKVFQTSCSHTWEDEDEMRRYVNHVWDVREKAREVGEPYEHIHPVNVCYGSFNCDGGAVLVDLDGNKPGVVGSRWVPKDAQPVVMWNYIERREEGKLVGWDVELDPTAEGHVWQAAKKMYGDNVIGGVQAPALRERLVCGSAGKPFRPLYPHHNWGSCPLLGQRERGCQATRSLADIRESAACYTSNEASWMAFEIMPDEAVVQVVMSDGVGDMVGLQELAEHLSERCRDESCCKGQVLARAIMERLKSKVAFSSTEDGDCAGHDDCSVAVAYRSAATRHPKCAAQSKASGCRPRRMGWRRSARRPVDTKEVMA